MGRPQEYDASQQGAAAAAAPPPTYPPYPPPMNMDGPAVQMEVPQAQPQPAYGSVQMTMPQGQPGYGATQYPPTPAPVPAIGAPWSSGLFDCQADATNAIVTAFFPCVAYGQIAEILDNGQTNCTSASVMYLALSLVFSCSILGAPLRTKLRNTYGLVEAPSEDCTLHLFCPPCALCQEFRELKSRGIDPSLGYMGNLALAQQQQQVATEPPKAQYMNM